MEDYYEYLDSNGVTTLYKLIKDDTVALIDSYSVTINGITTNLDNHVNNADIHTPITTIEGMIDTAVGSLNYATPDYVDTKISGLVNSSPETLDTLKELSDALGNDANFATTVVNQIGTKASKDDVYTKGETDTLLESKANSVHSHVVSDIADFPAIPTKTSQLINDSGFLTSSNGLITSVSWNDVTNKPNFSKVATSGSYNDLSNKPTIPIVYNKTLTIQKNGTNVATFTSNSNTDVTADITVPTKVSELSNDSGFITGISWDKVTNKPTLATVAISGSYTDLSNTPAIPTKVSQLENDTGFINALTDVVDTKSNQTINGTKKFTSDIARKYTAVDITTTPTSDMYAHFNFTDKNDKTVAYIQYAQKSNGVDYIGLRVRDKNSTTWGVQLNTNKEFVPLGEESYSLGSANYKWAKVYSDDVVHTSGNETINGNKTFTNNVHCYSLKHPTDNSYFYISGGSDWNKGANLFLYGSSLTGGNAGSFELVARNTTQTKTLTGYPNGALTWGGKSLAIDENLVHRSGNETIGGSKTFTSDIIFKNNYIDLTVTPSSTLYSNFIFRDKNNQTVAYIQYAKRNVDPDILGLYVNDSNKGLHGIQITSNNYLLPMGNNIWNLGSPNNIWANVYATTFNGNLKGNANSATYATTQATTDNSTKIATTAWVRTYVNSVVGSGSVGASISAYYSNATTVTAEGDSSTAGGYYPSDYSNYINIAPTVGTIYTGSQLFSSFTPTASGTINQGSTGPSSFLYYTTAKATANFSGAFSASAKYLCTTANAVRFRAYVSQGTSSAMGSPSVVDNSSAKSIFIRVQ